MLRTLFLFPVFSLNVFPLPYYRSLYVFLYYPKPCISIFDSLFCIGSFLFIFRFTSQSKAVHGSHQGSSSSCAR